MNQRLATYEATMKQRFTAIEATVNQRFTAMENRLPAWKGVWIIRPATGSSVSGQLGSRP
jgi:hypothetical protein